MGTARDALTAPMPQRIGVMLRSSNQPTMKGKALMKNWTPKKAHRAAVSRIDNIRRLLSEIAYLYGDVDQAVVNECDALIDGVLDDLKQTLDESLSEGRSL